MTTRLQNLAWSTYTPETEEIVRPLQLAQWRKTVNDSADACASTQMKESWRKDAQETHTTKVSAYEQNFEHLFMYSDGSLLKSREQGKRCVGYGVVGYHREIEQLVRIGQNGVEIRGIRRRDAGTCRDLHGRHTTHWILGILTLPKAAAAHLEIKHLHLKISTQIIPLTTIFDTHRWPDTRTEIRTPPRGISNKNPEDPIDIDRSPGHQGIALNERADEFAKQAPKKWCANEATTLTQAKRAVEPRC
ncbi:hypothetical protein R3P38DRAFT_1282435 [Favolaschia claudopus]|uniref:RNase H type-1 domain-containing protein n=1 Tax=Favolaschia claudopus TaxID=2862362 RepID=A0AAW0AZB8_9AGAR